MIHARCLSIVALGAVAFASSADSVAAQIRHHQGLTQWTHLGGSPAWTDDVAEPTSEFGMVDVLHGIPDLLYTSTPITLQPGVYVARCRVMKFQDSIGAEPLDLSTLVNSVATSVRLEAADQAVDQWVHTPSLIFKLTAASTLTFQLSNRDLSTNKQNYRFDSIKIGQVDLGDVILHEPLLTFSHSWGAPYFLGELWDVDSALGYVENLDHVWWFDMTSPAYILQAGTYTANIRTKIRTGGSGGTINFIVEYGNGQSKQVVWGANQQVIGRYTYTPNLTFTLTQAGPVRFKFWDITTGGIKQFLSLDSLSIRRGGFELIADGCPSSVGLTRLGGQPPYIGGEVLLRVRGVPTVAWMSFGLTDPNLDLTQLGAPNCVLHATPDVVAAAVANATNIATISLQVPVDINLIGVQWINQAAMLDPAANALQVVVSDAVAVTIGG